MDRTSIGALAICILAGGVSPACSCGSSDNDSDPFDATATGSGASGTGGGPQYDEVTIDPPKASLTVQLGKTTSQSYKAFGTLDGKKSEVTDSCGWSVDAAFGAMTGPTFTAIAHGGETQVSATC